MPPKRTSTSKNSTAISNDEVTNNTGAANIDGSSNSDVGNDSGIDLTLDIIGVDELQNHGINVADIQKLKSAGIHSISVSNNLFIYNFFVGSKINTNN